MDRLAFKDGASAHPGEVYVNLQFTVGASGAVPAKGTTGTRMAFIKSVVLSGTSDYTVTFDDGYVALLDWSGTIDQAAYNVAHAAKFTIKPADIFPSGAATLKFTARSDDGVGTATVPTAGDVIRMRFRLARLAGNG